MKTIISFKEGKDKSLLSTKFNPALLATAIANYNNRVDKLYLPSGAVLEGMRFDRQDIEAILANPNVTHLYLRFIESPTAPYITILAGGAVTTATDPNGTVDKNELYDYCELCPSACPTYI